MQRPFLMCIASHEKFRYSARFQDCIDCGDAVTIAMSDIDHHQVGLARLRRTAASASVAAISRALWPRFLTISSSSAATIASFLIKRSQSINCVLRAF